MDWGLLGGEDSTKGGVISLDGQNLGVPDDDDEGEVCVCVCMCVMMSVCGVH